MKLEINIEKKHIAVVIAAMLLISALTFIGFVMATGYDTSQPFHETLFADFITGKSSGLVTVDDELEVKGKVTVDDDMEVTGDLRYNNAIVGGCTDSCTHDSSGFYSCGAEWGKGRCGGSLANAVGIGLCTAQGGTSCGCDEGHKMIMGGMLCWTLSAGYSSTCYISLCIYP